MAELYGITGKIARIDLSREKVTVIEPDVELYKKFLGGATLGMYYLFKEGIVSPDVDPFSPENMLQVMLGPINGAAPNNRSVFVTKSPYGFICISLAGGQTAAKLRFAGWDGLQIVGKAKDPVYIAVIDDKIEIRDASDLWGKDAEEAEMELKKRVLAPIEYKDANVLTKYDMTPEWVEIRPPDPEKTIGAKRLAGVWLIGPAGENKVWFAGIMTEGFRAHGRYGSGAIAGSKNLKGIVVRGTKGQKLADKTKFLSIMNDIVNKEKQNYFWRSYGTAGIGYWEAIPKSGFPIRNWQWESWRDPRVAKALTGPFMDDASFIRKEACPGCALKCATTTQITSADPMLDGNITDMPDWEAMGMVGGNLGYLEMPGKTPSDPYTGDHFDQAEALAKTQYTTMLFDKYGMDFIEGGALIAFLMELRQRGYIGPEDLDGIDLKWGDVHAVDAIIRKIVKREGIGGVLAKGLFPTAEYFAEKKGKPEIVQYAQGCHRYAQPAHGTRSNKDRNPLEYVTVIRPCEHTGGGSGAFMARDLAGAIKGQNFEAVTNSLVICAFASTYGGFYVWENTLELVKAATGWTDFDLDALNRVGDRYYALGRLFSLHSLRIKDPLEDWDKTFPPRWFEPLPEGPYKGAASVYNGDPEAMLADLREYYKLRGWTEKGVPTKEKLEELGIADIAADIAKRWW